MKLLTFTLLAISLAGPAAFAAKTCGGTPKPRICSDKCYQNYDCKNGKWEYSPTELCEPCSQDKNHGMDKSQDKDQKEPEASHEEQD